MHTVLTFFLIVFGIIFVLILLAYSLLKGLLSGFVNRAKQQTGAANPGGQREGGRSTYASQVKENGHNPHKLNKDKAETVSYEEIKE